jgi:hypothetical protein
MAITPFDGFFTKTDLLAACDTAAHDLTALTDHDLSLIACYDRAGAQVLERQRALAIDEAERARLRVQAIAREQAAARQAAPAAGVSAADLEAVVAGLAPAVRTLLTRELADPVRRIAALEQRARVTKAAPTHGHTPVPVTAIDAAVARVSPDLERIIDARLEEETTKLLARGGTLEDYDVLRAEVDDARRAMYEQLRVLLEAEAAATAAR